MEWNKDKSIKLSLVFVYLFALILLGVDIIAPFKAGWFTEEYTYAKHSGALMLLTVYSGSAAAWPCLWYLRRLLINVRQGLVFVPENVSCMRRISWCCGAAAAITLLSALYFLPTVAIAISAAFMMLIVRIVKNAFQQAMEMKSELDLTI